MNGFPNPAAALRRLLSPRLDACLACGRPALLGASLPLLCRRCAARVPWIAEPRCLVCGRAQGCPDCLRPDAARRAFALNRSAALYDETMRDWIAAYKYGGQELFAEPFSLMLEQAYRRMRRELSARSEADSAHADRPPININGRPPSRFRRPVRSDAWSADCVTWVPVSAERLEERGFNQAELMARRLAKHIRLPARELLARTRHTGKQSFKTRAQRMHNLNGAFCLAPNLDPRIFKEWDLIGRAKQPGGSFPIQILLVDDIYTTGTTAAVCASVLQRLEERSGRAVSVYSLTLARS